MSHLEADARGIALVGQHDLGGHGDAMHVNVHRGYAYVGHMGADRVGTSILDVRDPRRPELVHQLGTPPGTHSHKVQVVDDLLLVNYERNPREVGTAESWEAGLKVFDIADPTSPREIAYYRMPGKGVHRMTYVEPPYVWLAGSDEGYADQFLIVLDLSDPTSPVEVARWAVPGIALGEESLVPEGRRFAHHHAIPHGDRLYGTWWDAGFTIHDITDPTAPLLVSHTTLDPAVSGATHTSLPLPGRPVLVVADEALDDHGGGPARHVRLFDISDETAPRLTGQLPVPEGEFRRDARFGPHNLHEMRPGTFQSSTRIHLSYFSAGLRVYELGDAHQPVEVAHYLPRVGEHEAPVQFNDLTVTSDGLVLVTDRLSRGLFILEDLGS